MTDAERITALEKRLQRMEGMLARALKGQGAGNQPSPPKPERRHSFKEEMDNLRKFYELGEIFRTKPREVHRAAQKRFFAEGGWTPPREFVNAGKEEI